MKFEFEKNLEKYADVIVKVGLNLQSGQTLLIGAPTSYNDGAPLESAPLIRLIVKKAYQLGCKLVEVMWADEELRLLRFQNAPKDSFKEYPKWRLDVEYNICKDGNADLYILGANPDLLNQQDSYLISEFQSAYYEYNKPVSELIGKNAMNWTVISASVKGWADKLFPNLHQEERKMELWKKIFDICRITTDDPIAAWNNHLDLLSKRCEYLNKKSYSALKLVAPGTDLVIGLPKNHIWNGGSEITLNGIKFMPNIPTEEIFTIPNRNTTEGIVSATKPLFYGGILVEGMTLKFSKGKIVEVKAKKGENFLLDTLKIDEGAQYLGEIALVPHSSPISQSGLLFYNTLIDENASNHIALGRGYKTSIKDGEKMSEKEFQEAGGNNSLIHVDFMIGSGEMNVDGILKDNSIEAIMRNGEFVF
jgi:aminopeptidase